MNLKNLFVFLVILLMFLVTPIAHAQIAIAWDEYTDTEPEKFVLESSLDQSIWGTEIDDIPITATAIGVTAPTTDNTRVYYRLRAVDTDPDPDIISDPSNVVSYYWTTGGGGQIDLETPAGIGFIDCSDPNNTQAEKDICTANSIQ